MVKKIQTGVKTDTLYANIGDFHQKGQLHLAALIAGPNFQGIPDEDDDPGYTKDAISDADFQTKTALSLRIQYDDNFPA